MNYEHEFSAKFLENVVDKEQPDLVVLMGKTADKEMINEAFGFFEKKQIPFVNVGENLTET